MFPDRARRALASPVALGTAAIVLLALVLLAPVPSRPRIWVVFSNAAHAPVFAAVSLLILQAIRARGTIGRRSATAWAFGAAVAVGIAVELLQGPIGRDSSWMDVWTDALGAACAMGWMTCRERTASTQRRRAGLAVALLAAGLALAPLANAAAAYGLRALRLPTIARFSLPWDLYFLELQSASAQRMRLPPEWSRPTDPVSLALHLEQGAWPGISLSEPAPDWRTHGSLNLDLTNPGRVPLELTLRVHDARHDQRHEDRFNRRLTVGPRSRVVITVPLADIANGPARRQLDLSQVAGLVLFATGDSSRPGTEFYLTRIWLQ